MYGIPVMGRVLLVLSSFMAFRRAAKTKNDYDLHIAMTFFTFYELLPFMIRATFSASVAIQMQLT
jgi:hypothetical protein